MSPSAAPSPAPNPVEISAATTAEDIVAIADGAPVSLSPASREDVGRMKEAADRIGAAHATYGRSTGVGANRTTTVSEADDAAAEHGRLLVRSHATDAGTPLPHRAVRAMAATRLAQLAQARSGIDPAVPDALVAALNADALPEIGRYGSIGTGDLAALSALALALAGERPTSAPLVVPPIRWGADSALPFLSSSALTVARGVLASDELRRLDRASRVLYALAIVAFEGSVEAFSPAAAAAISAPGVDEVAAEVRALLRGHDARAARIQDPYGLRVHPITQAALVTAMVRLDAQLGRLVTAAQENPMFDAAAGTVTHHGGFYQAQLAGDLDAASLAIARAATNAHARLRLANEPGYTGLRPFLAEGPAGASGLMMLEYTAAAALAEIRAAASPASLGTISLSRGTEEDAGFATQGVVQLERAVEGYRVVLSCELLSVARLVAQRGATLPPRLRPLHGALAGLMPEHQDQDLRPPLQAADALLDGLAEVSP
ncbi:aromatic amino acid lyase [Microbacterium marinilacus]|uniref:Aromatic amino acid ammonia-lyase n=1 Tax=Microbacterium marinilacus TaxID=415209 RepID=A0ABP7BS31_9MICO|nr:aromatic amino acid lyase [Microbacterium marinilacus]MBY0689109.1 aromatic amino acid lyase [Microbacterium marinilacus]